MTATTTLEPSTGSRATNRVALVTGGSRGIGAAIALRLAADGADVAVTYSSSSDRAAEVVAKVEALGRRAVAIQADAGDEQATRAAVERTVALLGRLDVLVANAGVFGGGPLSEVTMDAYDRTMAVNVRGVFVAAQAAAAHLGSGGRIIVIGSVNADISIAPTMTVYSASKAAVAGLTRGLARDLADQGVTVNVVQPGPVDTDMNPADGPMSGLLTPRTALGRYGTVEEVAGLVAFLASDEAGYITGESIDIDGGLTV